MSFAPTYLHCRYVLPSPPCTTPLSIAATPTLPLPPLPRLIIMQLNGEGVQTKAFWHPATTACFASRCENHFITQQHERHKTDATTAVVKIVTLGMCCNLGFVATACNVVEFTTWLKGRCCGKSVEGENTAVWVRAWAVLGKGKVEKRQIVADVAKGCLLQHVATGVAPSLHITPYRT